MDVTECIRTRRSIRKYLDVTIPRHILYEILDAGRLAPTAGNILNFKYIIVDNPALKQAVADACLKQQWIATAAYIVIICAEPLKAKRFYGIRGERLYTVQNCAAAAENMLLMAHNHGIGACWVGAFDENMIKRLLGVPDEIRPQSIITLGYPDEKVPIPAKYDIQIMVYWNGWRARIENAAAYLGWHSIPLQAGIKKGKESIKQGISKAYQKTKEIAKKVTQKEE